MSYWEIVTRSFRIAWDHKYLWLVAFFSGEGGGASYNYSQRTTGSTNKPPDLAAMQNQITTWIGDHIGLLVGLALVWVVLVIAFFILAAVCEGATIRGSAEHDAERPFSLGLAWRMGVHTMWILVRFRLLLIALGIPLFLLIAGWLIGLFFAVANHSALAAIPLVLTGLLLLALWFVYGTYLFFLDRLGSRALVLEQLMAIPALTRAHRLLFKRFGRTLLVWLVSIGVAIVLGIGLACVTALLVAPIVALAVFAGSGGFPAAAAVAVILAVIFVPILLVAMGFFAAQTSTYWTLAFRRLDLDYAPIHVSPSPQT